MDKKPLIGVSILAVVLLVMGSLSNVVGYQSVKSTVVNDSPLFQTRTQRATNQQQNSISSKFLGKGIGNFLCFSNKDVLFNSLNDAFEYVRNMDKQHYSQFMKFCIKRAHQTPVLNKIKDDDVRHMLQLIGNEQQITFLKTQIQSIDFTVSRGCWFAFFITAIFYVIGSIFSTILLILYLPIWLINSIFIQILDYFDPWWYPLP